MFFVSFTATAVAETETSTPLSERPSAAEAGTATASVASSVVRRATARDTSRIVPCLGRGGLPRIRGSLRDPSIGSDADGNLRRDAGEERVHDLGIELRARAPFDL